MPPDELSGWKAIASHLGVSVRTAQDYERHLRLPVKRQPGAKGRVYANADDLANWRAQTGIASTPDPVKPENGDSVRVAVRRLAGKSSWRIIAATLATTVVGLSAYHVLSQKGPPSQYRVEGNRLAVYDLKGNQLWEYFFPAACNPNSVAAPSLQPWFGDLDGDGTVETLFPYQPANYRDAGSTMFCFGQNGKPKWQVKLGGKVADTKQEFSTVYYVGAFKVVTTGAQGEKRVVVTSNHSWSYPDQVVVLDAAGKIVSEYWHPGHVLLMATADLDRDGTQEVLLAGINNAHDRATLVIFDSRRISGTPLCPTGDSHQLQGLGMGTEKAVVLFPKSCIGLREASSRAYDLRVTQADISLFLHDGTKPGSYLVYQLDYSLRTRSITISDSFGSHHHELRAEGKLGHDLTRREIDRLKEEVLVIRP